jgi:hypothetical protein
MQHWGREIAISMTGRSSTSPAMPSRDPITMALAILPVLYLSAFCHEVGHALAGRAAGFVITSFGMGTRRPFLVVPVAGTRIYFCLIRPLQGVTFPFPQSLFPTRARMALFLSGGILSHFVLTLVALALAASLPWGGNLWLVAVAVNAIMGISNLVPYTFKVGKATLRSDGAMILQTLRWGAIATPAPVVIQNLACWRPLWTATGDHLGLRANLLSAAASWIELDDIERAEGLLQEADSLPEMGPNLPSLQVFRMLVASGVALGRRRLEEAEEALTDSESLLPCEDNPPMLLSVAATRAAVRLLKGDTAGGRAELEALSGSSVAAAHPRLAMVLLESRLTAAASAGDESEVERLLAVFKHRRRTQPSVARDLRIDRCVARMHAAHQNWAAAEPAYRHALEAVGQLADAWADATERVRFVEKQSALIEEARNCLVAQGSAEDAARLTDPLLNSERVLRRPQEARERRDRRLRHAGLRVMALNAAVSVCAILGAFILGKPHGILLVVFAFPLVLFTSVAGLYLLFDRTLGRFIRPLRCSAGAVIIFFSCFPWLAVVFFLILLVTRPQVPR